MDESNGWTMQAIHITVIESRSEFCLYCYNIDVSSTKGNQVGESLVIYPSIFDASVGRHPVFRSSAYPPCLGSLSVPSGEYPTKPSKIRNLPFDF